VKLVGAGLREKPSAHLPDSAAKLLVWMVTSWMASTLGCICACVAGTCPLLASCPSSR
jgi:hypothetical protein